MTYVIKSTSFLVILINKNKRLLEVLRTVKAKLTAFIVRFTRNIVGEILEKERARKCVRYSKREEKCREYSNVAAFEINYISTSRIHLAEFSCYFEVY